MSRFGIMALAAAASLVLAVSVQAHERGSFHLNSKPIVSHHGYGHNTVFTGRYYEGRHHNHWSYTYWDSRYGCYLYWDPYFTCYYYYCVPAGCYYPVNYRPYNTYSWQQPVGGVLPAPVVDVPQVKKDVIVNVKNIQGTIPTVPGATPIAPTLPAPVVETPKVKTNVVADVKNIQGQAPAPIPADLPPQVGPMVPVR